MTSRQQRMEARALVGLRAELRAIADQLERVAEDFPELAPAIGSVQSAIEVVRTDCGDEVADERIAPSKIAPAAPRKRVRPSTGKPRGRPSGARNKSKAKQDPPIAEYGKRLAWRTGKEVLALLADAPNGMTPEAMAERLGLNLPALKFRIGRRVRKGHVRIIDPATSAYGITPAGRSALAKDQDSP